MPVAERADGIRLHWEEHGDPDGEPVLLIMGLGGSARAWWRLLPALEPGRRLIALDNRGTGRSSGVRGPLRMRDMVADVLAVLDDARLADAHVVGVSMGGMIAQHLALDHRERVRSLLLGCTSPGGGPTRSGPPPWRLLAAPWLRPVIGAGRTLELVEPALYAQATREHHRDRIAQDMRVRAEDATSSATLLAQMAAIGGHDVRTRLPELAGLDVTVVHGLEDALVPALRGDELAAGIPGAELVLIPGAGHLLSTDAPEATTAALVGHLERATAAHAAA